MNTKLFCLNRMFEVEFATKTKPRESSGTIGRILMGAVSVKLKEEPSGSADLTAASA